jgi:hypothetical protein
MPFDSTYLLFVSRWQLGAGSSLVRRHADGDAHTNTPARPNLHTERRCSADGGSKRDRCPQYTDAGSSSSDACANRQRADRDEAARRADGHAPARRAAHANLDTGR